MRFNIFLLALFALFGVFLLRGGITGYAISESCCFGADCPSENQCPTGATIDSPAFMSVEDNNALSIVGLLIVVISALMIFGYLLRRTREQKKEEEKEELNT